MHTPCNGFEVIYPLFCCHLDLKHTNIQKPGKLTCPYGYIDYIIIGTKLTVFILSVQLLAYNVVEISLTNNRTVLIAQ